MQVKTQLLIEDILWYLSVIAFICVALWLTSLDDDDSVPVETKPTVTVFIKQIDGINPLVFKECTLLAERVDC